MKIKPLLAAKSPQRPTYAKWSVANCLQSSNPSKPSTNSPKPTNPAKTNNSTHLPLNIFHTQLIATAIFYHLVDEPHNIHMANAIALFGAYIGIVRSE